MTRRALSLLLELDGVLRRWDAQVVLAADLERRHRLVPGTLASLAFDPQRLLPAVTGEVPDEVWRLGMARALVPLCGDSAATVVADWSESPGEVDVAVLELVRAVRRSGHPVVLVSNATTRLELDLVRLGLHAEVDAVVSSARLGAAKPDRRVYAVAAAAATTPPGRCLFVDDAADHVRAAAEAGLQAHRYRGVDDLRVLLGARGLLERSADVAPTDQ